MYTKMIAFSSMTLCMNALWKVGTRGSVRGTAVIREYFAKYFTSLQG
jgi:hypothetical protein